MSQKNKSYKKYYIQGMHCASCRILIKQDIENLEGIKNADVSMSKRQVTIWAQDKKYLPTVNELNKLFEQSGYIFGENKIEEKKLSKNDLSKVVALALAFIICFYLLERSGLFMKISLNSQSSLIAYFIFGLAAGLSSCAALVGGLLLSLSKKWNELYGGDTQKSKEPFIYFNLSRILTFALLGGLLGYLGSFFKVSVTATSLMTILIAIFMLVLGLQMIGVKWFSAINFNFIGNNKYINKNTQLQGKYMPLLVGGLTFFVPCGFTLIVQSQALNSGSFYLGMLQLTAFALGTLPILALISFTSIKFYAQPAFSQKFSLFSGVVIVFFALYTMNSQLNVLGLFSLNDLTQHKDNSVSKPIAEANNDYQVLQLEAKGFEYYPKTVTIRSGVKTKFDIYDNGVSGCARALYARGLYKSVIQLRPGLNSVEFVAPSPGTYKISCSMGMVDPVIVQVQ